MRTLRLFALLDDLRQRSTAVTAEELADALNVSVRTIYRDMATLQAMGVPVRGEAGFGYAMEPGYFLPPLHFDAHELDAIMLGLRMIQTRGDTLLTSAARRASGKIAASLPKEARDPFLDRPLRAVARASATEADADKWLLAVRTAIQERLLLAVRYRDQEGRQSERIVRPLGLTVFDAVWLVTVWCELRDDFRNLRVDRILQLQLAGSTFHPERGKRFSDYLETL